jgi:toxin ParE1/3/4
MGPVGRVRNTRELVFSNLPYIVVYRLSDAVDILAVVHTARKWPKAFD